MNTRRTLLTGMVRIELLDSDASALGLVRDELLEWWKYNEWTSDYKQFSRISLGLPSEWWVSPTVPRT
jgi:hypothetical protein